MDEYYPPASSPEERAMQLAWRIVVPVLAERLASAPPAEETT